MEKEDNHILNPIILIGVILAMLFIFFLRNDKYIMRLRKNHIVVCGDILKMRSYKGISAVYTFVVNGNTYKSDKSATSKTFDDYKKGITKILIAAQKDDPDNNRILTDYEDYEQLVIKEIDTANIICR